MLKINIDKCTGCKLCEKGCPYNAIVVDKETKKAIVLETCTLCGTCINACKFGAITLERKIQENIDVSKYMGIIIWGEIAQTSKGYRFRDVVFELLGKAIAINENLHEPISVAVLKSKDIDLDLNELFYHGADIVYLCEDDVFKFYSTDAFTIGMANLIIKKRPSIVFFGATANGRDLAPRIAARLRLGLTADCTEFNIDDKKQLIQTRPAFGGNIMASIISPFTRPQMATARPNNFSKIIRDPKRTGSIKPINIQVNKSLIRTKIIEEVKSEIEEINIQDADILVSVGRGIGSKDKIPIIREFAEQIHGVLASSRALVEIGWTNHTIQVGQSGKTVSPKLYIALGISGAIQHLVGMQTSDIIIAINKDPEAPIFKVADFGIIGDANEIIPKFLEIVRNKGAFS